MTRNSIYPKKNSIYWDAAIPMEYYEDEFIEFEEYLMQTGQKKLPTADNSHANSEYYLDKFAQYEKWMKADCRREWQKSLKWQKKNKLDKKVTESELPESKPVKVSE